MNSSDRSVVKAELDGLISKFFRAVSFEVGGVPAYKAIPALFIDRGVLIEIVGSTPEILSIEAFIRPRDAVVRSGTLSRFHEAEVSESTVIFGNVAHRFSVCIKSGTSNGIAFEAQGLIRTQFVNTPAGWKMSAMTWDDERTGLSMERTGVARQVA